MRTLKPTDEVYMAFGRELYENAKRPLYPSRRKEYKVVKEVCRLQFALDLAESDFDNIIAQTFGGGTEYDWPKE